MGLGVRVQGLRLRVWGSGFRTGYPNITLATKKHVGGSIYLTGC